MLTGELPYESPSPSDLERLMRGELAIDPRTRNPKIPRAISDIVVNAMAPEVPARYPRVSDLLGDLIAASRASAPRTARPARAADADDVVDIHSRLKARETPQARFCWHCRKPLHARSDRCPFCGEAQ